MWDFWTAVLFLCIAIPISLILVGFLGYIESKNEEKKEKK